MLERLLHWVLENIVVVVFLPFVFAWLKRVGQALVRQEGEQQRQPNRMPSFGGERTERRVPSQEQDSRPREEDMRRAQTQRRVGEDEQEGSSSRDYGDRPVPAAVSPTSRAAPVARSSTGSGLAVPAASPSHQGLSNAPAEGDVLLNPKDAMQGVIWAEVLGPPRAKNPHRKW